jgi:glycosyltransferase involved in cell wall biosynthesis
MKILFILENFYPHIGGVEVLFKNLTEGLVKKGHEVMVLTHKLKGTKDFELMNGVKIFRIETFQSRYLFTIFSLRKAVKLAKKADIIHTTTFSSAPVAWLAAGLTKKPVLMTVHEVWIGRWRKYTDFSPFRSLIHEFLERMIYSFSFDKYVAVSQSTKRQLEGIGKKNVTFVYNGFDYENFNPKKFDGKKIRKKLGIKDKTFLYFAFGRPGASKGFEYLIMAAKEIKQKIPSSKLLIILGKNKQTMDRYNRIKKMIKEDKLQDHVILSEPVRHSDLPYYLAAADCVVVPSFSEGFGYTIAETCAIGRPLVATNTTAIPEVISGRYVLVKPKSSDAIAQGVVMIYKKQYIKTSLKKFLWKNTIKGYEKIYGDLLK